jgi:5'-3' exonuclease
MPVTPTLFLIDGSSQMYRAYHAFRGRGLSNQEGHTTHAVYVFVTMLRKLIKDHAPAYLAASFDLAGPTFRDQLVADYKATRAAMPDDLAEQIKWVHEACEAMGVPIVTAAGYEADDVIGTLAARAVGPVDVVSGDRDLFQVVRDDGPVRVRYTAKGVGRAEVVDEAEVTRRYGIPGRAYADLALLRGDPSDGLPGVPGVGEKTAAALVTRFGGLAGLLAALDRGGDDGFPAGSRARLLAARPYLAAAPAVVRVATDVPLPTVDDTLPTAPREPARLVALSDRWGLDGPLNRLLAAVQR